MTFVVHKFIRVPRWCLKYCTEDIVGDIQEIFCNMFVILYCICLFHFGQIVGQLPFASRATLSTGNPSSLADAAISFFLFLFQGNHMVVVRKKTGGPSELFHIACDFAVKINWFHVWLFWISCIPKGHEIKVLEGSNMAFGCNKLKIHESTQMET